MTSMKPEALGNFAVRNFAVGSFGVGNFTARIFRGEETSP